MSKKGDRFDRKLQDTLYVVATTRIVGSRSNQLGNIVIDKEGNGNLWNGKSRAKIFLQ